MKSDSLKHHTLYSFISNISDALVFVLMILAGRTLGPERFGVFSFSLAMATVFLSFSNFGLNTLAIRSVSRDPTLAQDYLANILSWKMVLGVIAIAGVIAVVFLDPNRDSVATTLVCLLAVAVGIRYFSMTARCFLQALGRFDLEAIAVVSEQAILLVGGATVLLLGYGLVGFAWMWLAARVVGCVVAFTCLSRVTRITLGFNWQRIKMLQWQALPIGVAMFVATMSLHADTLILDRLLGYGEVGLYNSAFKIYAGLFLLPSVFCTVLLPRLSKTFVDNKQDHNRLLVIGMGLSLVLSLPICVAGILLSRLGMVWTFGEAYESAVPVMQVLFVVLAITFQVWWLRVILIAVNRQHALMVFSIIGLVLRVGFDLLLIPQWGIIGAAVAAGLSELLICSGIWIYLARYHFRVRGVGDLLSKIRAAVATESPG